MHNEKSVTKESYDKLYAEHQELLKKYKKLNSRFETITKHSDRNFSKHSSKLERTTRLNNRLNVIVKHSDNQASKVLQQKSDLEIALELELENEKVLLKEIEDTQREVVYTMGAIGETRSKETGNHVKRVAEYSKYFALYYGLSEDEAELLKQASPMHDIGKVAISDTILNKPAKLTSFEFSIMQEHAKIGYEMLKHSSRPLMQAAAIVAYEHHEKFNGKGYPRGLVGEEIHIYGRITAIADVFDALGSSRIYKNAWSDEEIFQLFKEERGQHFDPDLIDIFFNNLDDFLIIREGLKDLK